MMKKQNQLYTNSSASNIDETQLLTKITKMLNDSVPKSLLGMLATAKKMEDGSIEFYNRYRLHVICKNNFKVVDNLTNDVAYDNIALFSNAVHIIYSMSRNVTFKSAPKEKVIFGLDQEYGRCLSNAQLFSYKVKNSMKEQQMIYADKLSDSICRLQEIKNKLFKVI